MTIKNLGDLLIYLGAVAAAISAIGYLAYRVIWRPFVRTLKAELGATRQTAEAVHAEVSPNHGSSMKDAVTRTEQKVDQLDRRFTDHLINHPGA